MCRWVAYAGPEIYLEDILFHQSNSIVSQSLSARESVFTTNGDGFGVAWYTARTQAGLFKDVLPAWNDANLRSLAAHIRTRLFFAHVRATTGTSVNRANCHPFIWRQWTFMHNGQIGNWSRCRKALESHIHADVFPHREGTTDSEALFLLAISLGLEQDPVRAIQETLRIALKTMQDHAAEEPLRATMAITNGQEIWAVRCASDARSPSLYYGSPQTRASEKGQNPINTIASEPMDGEADHWHRVDAGTGIHWTPERITHFDLHL